METNKTEKLKDRWLELSRISKFFWIIFLHFFINIITSIIFFLDDFSLENQIVHCIIHLAFFVLLVKLIYLPKKENSLKKKNEKWWILGFIILNLIPFSQGYKHADNGFAPMWSILPQTNFGLPFIYLHWFPTDLENIQEQVLNPVVHINILVLNLYLWGIFTIMVLAIKKRLLKKKKKSADSISPKT